MMELRGLIGQNAEILTREQLEQIMTEVIVDEMR
jgi:hypothetical protein